MKQVGNAIIGDPVQLDAYTTRWNTIRLHPSVFYRRYDQFQQGLKSLKGIYAEIDMGDMIYIRFSDKEDLTNFHRMHHEYI